MLSPLPYEIRDLRLRLLRSSDLAAFHGYRSDANVARYQGWSPMTQAQAAQFIATQGNAFQIVPGRWTQLAIAQRDTDELIGDVGFCISRDEAQAEFGLSIAAHAQGKGYATQAVHGLIELLFSNTAVSEVVASTDVRNLPCLAVLRHVGMRCTGTRRVPYKGEVCEELTFCLRRNSS